MEIDYKKQGKSNRARGKAFELKVRHDLEKKGWIVDRWSNNVEFDKIIDKEGEPVYTYPVGKLITAKHTFNPFTKAMSAGNGFPDFICIKRQEETNEETFKPHFFVKFVECKINGKLDKIEKEKIEWLKDNLHIHTIIAVKGERGEIIYE